MKTINNPLFFLFSITYGKSESMRRVGIFAIVFLSFLFVLTSSASATGITVCSSGCDYATIQNAVGNASSGDTISVSAGSYTENLIIDKTLVLHGAGSDSVTLTGQEKIRANNVSLDGFTVVGTVIVDDSISPISGGMIFNNTMTGNSYGIRVGYTAGNGVNNISIVNNRITGNTNKGILFYDAGDYASQHVSNITVSGNEITNNSGSGISTYGTGHNIITNNIVTGNNGNGISIKYDNGDLVAGNIVSNNTAMGINVHQVTNSTIENNTVSNHMSMAVVTTFWGTSITAGKGSAIYIHEVSEGNIIRSNDFINNKIGVLVSKEGNNTAPANNSINNNRIVNNTEYVIINALVNASHAVDARDNWWGSITPNASKFSGNVSYYPFCMDAGCSIDIGDELEEFSGNTTDFSAIADWSNVTLILDAGEGTIEWGDGINLTGSNLQFDNYIEISHRRISLNAPMMPELDHPATLTFKNAGYANINDFSVKRNGVTCPNTICSNIRIEGNSVLADVNQMSDYWLADSVLGSMPSITGQLVVSLGFGIMGLFAVLTLIYASYEQDPETFIKVMVSIIIIVLAIVAVWQGIVI